ncbi:MAG: hypothetical protein ACP5Q5_09135 [Brevinematia bacterium]
MSDEKLTFTLTGNFQYDLGILGLKKVLDFFGFKYESDGNFYISIQRTKEQLLEDIIAKLNIDNGINYFRDKIVEDLKKIKKNNNDLHGVSIDSLIKSINTDFTQENDLTNVYKKEGLNGLISKISNIIYSKVNNDSKKNEIEAYITDLIWQKSVNLLNNILHNFQGDMNAKGPGVLEKAKNKLNSEIIGEAKCSFCDKKGSKRLTRDVFFFAPAQYNSFWFNEPNLFICPTCLVANLAITQSFTFLGNKQDAIVLYIPNLSDMETLNSILNNTFSNSNNFVFGKILKPIIEYENLKLRQEATVKELQILGFKLDSKNPLMEMFILTETSIRNIIKIEEKLNEFFTEDNVRKLIAYVREKNKYVPLDLSKELLEYVANNQKIFYLVPKYARYCIMSENFKQNKTKNPPVINFSSWLFLKFIEIHYILEDKDMNEFKEFKDLGQRIRQRIYMILTNNKTKPINWNTFDNKIISISNSFLNASKGSLQQFQELLSRIIISYGLNVSIDTINIITKENYPEIATTIALAVLVAQSGENREQTDTPENLDNALQQVEQI